MRLSTSQIPIFVVLVFVGHFRCVDLTTRTVVRQLTDADFEEALLDYEHTLAIFFSPLCVHCMNFISDFHAAADTLIRNEPPVHSVAVNCKGSGVETCRREHVVALPTIKIYKRGTLFDEYEGARTEEDLVNYIRNLVGITSYELNGSTEGGEFAEDQKQLTVVAFLKKTGSFRDSYFSLPPQLSKDIRFGHYTIEPEDTEVANRVKLIQPEYMRNRFEPFEYFYEGDGEDLLEFILKHRHGLVGLRRPRNIDDFGPPLVIAYLPIDIVRQQKMFTYWRNRILIVAAKYNDYLNFAVSPIQEFHLEFDKFGIDLPEDNQPVIFAILQDNTKYLMPSNFSVENFENFIKSLIDRRAEPFLRSQPVPEENFQNGGQVVTVVARNFKQTVILNDKDILLVLHAPWCSVCRELDEIFSQLAEILSEDNVLIVKMDATANEIPAGFEVDGFPTIYWLAMAAKDVPEVYDGGRTLQEMIEFIAAHAATELVGYDRHGRRKQDTKEEL